MFVRGLSPDSSPRRPRSLSWANVLLALSPRIATKLPVLPHQLRLPFSPPPISVSYFLTTFFAFFTSFFCLSLAIKFYNWLVNRLSSSGCRNRTDWSSLWGLRVTITLTLDEQVRRPNLLLNVWNFNGLHTVNWTIPSGTCWFLKLSTNTERFRKYCLWCN